MKYFDEAQLLHEKAGYVGLVLHGTAGSEMEGVLGGLVGALGRAGRSGRGEGTPVRREGATRT